DNFLEQDSRSVATVDFKRILNSPNLLRSTMITRTTARLMFTVQTSRVLSLREFPESTRERDASLIKIKKFQVGNSSGLRSLPLSRSDSRLPILQTFFVAKSLKNCYWSHHKAFGVVVIVATWMTFFTF